MSPRQIALTLPRDVAAVKTSERITASNSLSLIEQMSKLLAKTCRRRFDVYYGTHYYDAVASGQGGHVDGNDLILQDTDLLSLAAVAVTGNAAIDVNTDTVLLPYQADYKTAIRLKNGGSWWAGNDPVAAIAVTGWWGYPGYYTTLGALESDLNDTSPIIGLTSTAAYDAGMLLRVGDELMYVVSVTTNTSITVDRAVNGTVAASHSNGDGLRRWIPDEIAQRLTMRLVAWGLEQNTSPTGGQYMMGDLAIPLDFTSIPKDVREAIVMSGLLRPPRIFAA